MNPWKKIFHVSYRVFIKAGSNFNKKTANLFETNLKRSKEKLMENIDKQLMKKSWTELGRSIRNGNCRSITLERRKRDSKHGNKENDKRKLESKGSKRLDKEWKKTRKKMKDRKK